MHRARTHARTRGGARRHRYVTSTSARGLAVPHVGKCVKDVRTGLQNDDSRFVDETSSSLSLSLPRSLISSSFSLSLLRSHPVVSETKRAAIFAKSLLQEHGRGESDLGNRSRAEDQAFFGNTRGNEFHDPPPGQNRFYSFELYLNGPESGFYLNRVTSIISLLSLELTKNCHFVSGIFV